MKPDLDTALGYAATATGTSGIGIQWWLNFGNLGVLVLNGLLAVGGIYLLALRIRHARRQLKE